MSSRELYLGPNLTVHRIRHKNDGPTETFVALSYGSTRSYSCREKSCFRPTATKQSPGHSEEPGL